MSFTTGGLSSSPSRGPRRKRTLSNDDEMPTQRKRTRHSLFAFPGEPIDLGSISQHPLLAGSSDYMGDTSDVFAAPRHLRPRLSEPAPRLPRMQLTASTSYTDLRVPRSEVSPQLVHTEAMALIRQHSAKTEREMAALAAAAGPPVADSSATKHLRARRMAIDFSMTPSAGAEAWPVAWSQNNMLVFSRGNRVHFKNLAVDSGTGQLCKVRESHGGVQLIACAGEDQPNIVAVCTGKGRIELWDLLAKKMTASWSTHSFGAVAWNGPILSVGSNRGTIRHFDTRIKDTPKMKEQTKRVTRHQAKICSLTWHEEGKMFASGDASGVVLAWDSRQNVPLDVGETVQRRKKMQHVGPVTALTWCPWQSRMLASGDSAPDGTGTIRIWDVSTTPSAFPKSNHPKKLELDATIRSLHFSTQCKELLCAHGPGKFTPAPPPSFGLDSLIPYDSSPRPAKIANSVVVYAYPTLRSLATVSVSCQDVAGSVQSPNGLRIALAIPGEKQVSVWDVWAKRKDLRRHSSFDTVIR